MGRIIAIDYGRKRSGLAVTDENRIIAGPLTTLPSHEVIGFLKKYIPAEHVDCIVVGKSVQMNGINSESMIYIQAFYDLLKRSYPAIPIEWVDERFTSKMASAAIALSGMKKKNRQDKALIDKVSAVIILQSYLEVQQYKTKL